MRHFRFHIGTLVILVLVLGVSFAAVRESNEIWDSGVFTVTVGVLLTSVLLAIHRTEKRRAFWLGFALFGAAYLGLSVVTPIESRLLTTKSLAYLDSKMPRSVANGVGVAYGDFDNDGTMDIYVVNNSKPIALYANKGNGTFQDVTATVGLNQPSNGRLNSLGLWLRGSVGSTENFAHIGHSLVTLIAAFVGAHISRRLYDKNRRAVQGPASPLESTLSDGWGG
jgi:hypothetical protein